MSDIKQAQVHDSFLKVKNLTVEYFSKESIVHAVNGVDLTLKKGQTLGLVGETGAGKTTIAKSILRILPDVGARIVSGEVYLEGQNISNIPEAEMRDVRGKKISMIFQDPMTALNPVQTVGDQIEEVVALHSTGTKAEFHHRAEQMLELVGIPKERFNEYPHQFSGGMKQRVVIAIALACSPELLLADEPTTALDVTIQAQVLRLISRLKKELGTSMILITHDMGVVATFCDYVAVVYAGKIIEYGDKFQIFDHYCHPYTKGLFGAIPSMTVDAERLHPIEGLPPDPTMLPDGCAFWPRCKYASERCRHGSIEMSETKDGHLCRCCNLSAVAEKGED